MNRIAPSHDWTLKFCGNLSQKLRQKVWAKTTWYGDPQSPLSPSLFNGGDCKVTQVIYDTSLALGKLKHLHRLKYKPPDVSAEKLSTPETWAHDIGLRQGCGFAFRVDHLVFLLNLSFEFITDISFFCVTFTGYTKSHLGEKFAFDFTEYVVRFASALLWYTLTVLVPSTFYRIFVLFTSMLFKTGSG